MLFGPLPIHFINRLREKLHAHGGESQVFSSKTARDELRAKLRAEGLRLYPRFNPQHDLLYIEIPKKDLLIVKGELEQMGIPLVGQSFDPQLERSEFLCPRCGYARDLPGTCPRHSVPLLEFSDWAEARGRRRERLIQRMLQILLAALLAIIAVRLMS